MQFSIILQSLLATVALANDVRFFTAFSCNDAAFAGCYGIARNVCCQVRNANIRAVSVSKGARDVAQMWSNGGCSKQQCSAGGAGTYCCVAGGSLVFTGGSYYTGSAKRAEQVQTTCTSTAEPNVFGFVSGNTSWEVRAAEVKGSFAELQKKFESVPAAEKVNWLKSHGAVSVAAPADKVTTEVVKSA